ncbi:MAG: LamG-like jellyroll fold domain-containing protein, partial [Solirubrobacterales bacterium]
FTQVVGVWDGVTISIYVDGELHGQVEATKRPSSSSTFYVGYGEIRPWFKGAIDEVAYYGKALTPGRVLEHYLADPPPPPESGTEPSDPGDDPTGEPGDPGPDYPVEDPGDDPVDDPVYIDPDPKPGDPDGGPDEVEDSGPYAHNEAGGTATGKNARAKAKAKRSKTAIKKCMKIKNIKKRKQCVKRAKKY